MTNHLKLILATLAAATALAACSTASAPVATIPGPAALPAPADPIAQYKVWITEARAKHPYAESEQRMFDVMMCESGGRPKIVNAAGPYTGLFQYATGTWKDDWNTYRDAAMTDPRAQIFATALAWQKGMQSHWTCYRKTK